MATAWQRFEIMPLARAGTLARLRNPQDSHHRGPLWWFTSDPSNSHLASRPELCLLQYPSDTFQEGMPWKRSNILSLTLITIQLCHFLSEVTIFMLWNRLFSRFWLKFRPFVNSEACLGKYDTTVAVHGPKISTHWALLFGIMAIFSYPWCCYHQWRNNLYIHGSFSLLFEHKNKYL